MAVSTGVCKSERGCSAIQPSTAWRWKLLLTQSHSLLSYDSALTCSDLHGVFVLFLFLQEEVRSTMEGISQFVTVLRVQNEKLGPPTMKARGRSCAGRG